MQRIIYSREALKALQRIDGLTANRIVAKIELLAAQPERLSNNIRRLKGSEKGLLRLRVGDWRVIYDNEGNISHRAHCSSGFGI
ncbi:type II toxin-antitoxin system RelE family toxin [Novosphingopyxis sp.]|uniref:type II toxin-antitoxin system RelE family toxin n=1 Tax=Novosphingopyxis sp. TaxID=2709690 RepID=UPI003B596D1B